MRKRKKDILILITILGLAFIGLMINLVLFKNDGAVYGEIYVDGELIETIDLTKNRTFSIEERPNIVFAVKDHAIAFIESDCPDQVCIHSGYLGNNGQSASCLPNKTTIAIHSRNQEEDEPDLVVWTGNKVNKNYEK